MRKSKRKIRILIIIFCLIFLFIFRYVSFFNEATVKAYEHLDSNIEIHVIDVGQAESILLVQGEHAMLIDTGNMFDGKTVTKYLKSNGISRLDMLAFTHYHVDHMGGAHKVISSINVEKIMCMDWKYISTFQEAFWYTDMQISRVTNSVLHAKKIPIESPYEKNGVLKSFKFGDANVEILSQETHANIVNNKSLVMKVTYGDVSALFTGDSQNEVENYLLEAEMDISADILNVGHHGSKTSTSMDFLEAVNPRYALISCGEDNAYAHPNSFVIKKLEKKNVSIYRTDTDGSIVVVTDGTKEGIEVKKMEK